VLRQVKKRLNNAFSFIKQLRRSQGNAGLLLICFSKCVSVRTFVSFYKNLFFSILMALDFLDEGKSDLKEVV